jgi:hypothetical protein
MNVYIEVACASESTPHAYVIATPLEHVPGTDRYVPHVPRFCAWCQPPEKTDATGIAIDRKTNVAGGVFIASWRHARLDDHNVPVEDPVPMCVA